jgi:hypothetical protein
MSNLYTVTAANLFFWQKLAVMASDKEEAAAAFRAYLRAPQQQESEEVELDDANEDESEEMDRDNYRYDFDDKDVEEDDLPVLTVGGQYTGEIGETVKMVNSGGNG